MTCAEGESDGAVPTVPAGFMREVVTCNTGGPRVWYHFCEELDGKMVFTSMGQMTGGSRNSIELLLDQQPQLVEAGLSLGSFSFETAAPVVRAPKPPMKDSHIDSSGATVDSTDGSGDPSNADDGISGEYSLPVSAGLSCRHASHDQDMSHAAQYGQWVR